MAAKTLPHNLAPLGLQKCNRCSTIKPFSEFTLEAQKYRRSTCNECRNRDRRLRRGSYSIQKLRSLRNKSKAWRENNREASRRTVRNATLKSKYGITVDDYDALLLSQNGGCKICEAKQAIPNSSRAFAVDHDHATGKIRGLLCQACNSSLGRFNDDPKLLIRAAKYLAGEL